MGAFAWGVFSARKCWLRGLRALQCVPVARSLFCGCCVGTMKSLVAGSLFCGCVGLANVCRIRSRESAECAKYGCNFCTRVAKSNGFITTASLALCLPQGYVSANVKHQLKMRRCRKKFHKGNARPLAHGRQNYNLHVGCTGQHETNQHILHAGLCRRRPIPNRSEQC